MIETPGVYIPMDRWQAIARGATLPDYTRGAALFADISGFTMLTEALVRELGVQRGSEELTRQLNLVYDGLIVELHRYGGSVISFNGDAITCWFDESLVPGPLSVALPEISDAPHKGQRTTDNGLVAVLRAVACALAMQQSMARFASVSIPSGSTVALAMKVAVASGPARRFLVGDPQIQLIDVLAGATLDHLADAEHHAGKGEVVLDRAAAAALGDAALIAEWREDAATGGRYGVVERLAAPVADAPWPPLAPDALTEEQVRPWLLAPVYERLRSGQGEFLAELRPAVALFLSFGGIDYDGDPAAGAKLDAYIWQVQAIIARYEGALFQLTIGDKGCYLYAAFGAPLAHEDDAVRAASAAIELQALELDFITPAQIGINQGRVRAGAYGGIARRTYGVMGNHVNLAARLMQAAAPGQVLVSKVARQAAGETFLWESLPDIRAKGVAEPVAVFSLLGVKERRATRLQVPQYALPMVGREAELALINQKLALASGGQGQVIGITGEAGMGKSRLVFEVIRLANDRGLIGYGGECQSYGANTSYLVWQNIYRGLFDLDEGRPQEEQAAWLEARLAAIDPALVPRLPLLGPVLGLSLPDNEFTRAFDAKLRKVSLESLLVDCMRAQARAAPLLLVLEDCHWLDPLSHDLLETIGRAIADLPVLLVLTYRPTHTQAPPAPLLSQLRYFTEIRMVDFQPQEAEQLISLKLVQLYDSYTEVSPDLVKQITARAEGNPFYIEELLNYLQDQGLRPQDIEAFERLDLPTSLHSLILSRIDRLSESQKSMLKVASVIGRLFKAVILWGVYPQIGDLQQVVAELNTLSRLDLTALDVPDPEITYLFKHIITQEVAYESLPYATRATLHDQIGQCIERTYGSSLDKYVDLLAYHFSNSQNEAKQREYLLKAGEAAQATYANASAIDYYQRVLPLLPPEQQAPVMLKLGRVLELVGQWDEAAGRFQEALALAEQLGDRRMQAQSRATMGELLRKRGLYADAAAWQAQARAGFEALDDLAGVAQVIHYAGTLSAQQGDYDAARALYTESLAIRRQLGDKPRIASLLSNLGIVARYQGEYATARALHEEGLAIRREVGDRLAIANSLGNLGNVALDQGDYAEARARSEESLAIEREVGDRWAIAISLNNLGNVVRIQGDYAAAQALYEESLRINRELGDTWALAYLLEDMGALAAQRGQPERALRLVGAASVARDSIGAPLSRVEQAKLEQLLAPARQALSEPAQALAFAAGLAMSLPQALDLALSQPEIDPAGAASVT